MTDYEVVVEAMGYGDVFAEAEALETAIEAEPDWTELSFTVMGAENGMVALRFTLQAADGLDAHSTAMEVWEAVWEASFPDRPAPSQFAVTAKPAGVREAAPS